MNKLTVSRHAALGILAQVVLAVALVWLSNLSATIAIERFGESSLTGLGKVDVGNLQAEIEMLSKDVVSLRGDLSSSAATVLPTVQEIRDLADQTQVHLRHMEKQTSHGAHNGERDARYSILAVGGLDNQMDFLKQLEERHVLVSESMVLQRYNEDGTTLALALVMAVRER